MVSPIEAGVSGRGKPCPSAKVGYVLSRRGPNSTGRFHLPAAPSVPSPIGNIHGIFSFVGPVPGREARDERIPGGSSDG